MIVSRGCYFYDIYCRLLQLIEKSVSREYIIFALKTFTIIEEVD